MLALEMQVEALGSWSSDKECARKGAALAQVSSRACEISFFAIGKLEIVKLSLCLNRKGSPRRRFRAGLG